MRQEGKIEVEEEGNRKTKRLKNAEEKKFSKLNLYKIERE